MRVVVLGSGTSAGVPTLGCVCAVCTSTDPRNKRLRASVVIREKGQTLLIDCGTDFRTQAIAQQVHDVHAVLLTHTHADHVNGLDDLRSYNMVHKHPIPIYGSAAALADIRTRFAYCFVPPPPGGGIPDLHLHEVRERQPMSVCGLDVLPLKVMHGQMPILGFRIGNFAYLTDVSEVPTETYSALEGVHVLITSALRQRPHPTHMSLDEALVVARRVGARQTYFTHMCHDLDHGETNAQLPPGVELAYDGLVFEA